MKENLERTTLKVLSGKDRMKEIFPKQFSCGKVKFWDMNNLIFIQLVCPHIIRWEPNRKDKTIWYQYKEGKEEKERIVSYEDFSNYVVAGRKIKCNSDFSKIFIDLFPGEIHHLELLHFLDKIGILYEEVVDYKKIINELKNCKDDEEKIDEVLKGL